MIHLPDPNQIIPDRLKSDNWAFAFMSRSDDPAYKCQNIVNLVNNLYSTLSIAELLDTEINLTVKIPSKDARGNAIEKIYSFKTLDNFIKFQISGANYSWNLYSQGKTGEAVEIASAVLRELLFLVYDDRFTTVDTKTSFYGRSDK